MFEHVNTFEHTVETFERTHTYNFPKNLTFYRNMNLPIVMLIIYATFIITCIFIRSCFPLANDGVYTCVGTPVPISVKNSKSRNNHGWYIQYRYDFNSTVVMNPSECSSKETIIYSTKKYKSEQEAEDAMVSMKQEHIEKTYPTELKSALDDCFFIVAFIMFFCCVLICMNSAEYNENQYLLH